MADTMHRRRYLALKEWGARRQANREVAMGLRQMRRDTPGTTMPAAIPFQAALLTAGYEALEDLPDLTAPNPVDVPTHKANAEAELQQQGLNARQARAIVQALTVIQGV